MESIIFFTNNAIFNPYLIGEFYFCNKGLDFILRITKNYTILTTFIWIKCRRFGVYNKKLILIIKNKDFKF